MSCVAQLCLRVFGDAFLHFQCVLDDCEQSDLFREEKDEQTYSQPTVVFGSRAGFAKGSHTLPCFHMVAEPQGS